VGEYDDPIVMHYMAWGVPPGHKEATCRWCGDDMPRDLDEEEQICEVCQEKENAENE